MKSKLRSSVPVILSTTTGLVAAALMFVPRGDAAPLPTAYSAKASADVWHIDDLDLDMSGDPAELDLSVSRVEGITDAALNPRSLARAENVAGTTAAGQSVRRGAISSAGATSDTTAPVQGAAPAGAVTGMVEVDQAILSSRGRWVGDAACLPAEERLTDSRASSAGSRLVATDVPDEDATVTIPIVDVEVPLPDDGGELPLPDPELPPVDVPGLPTGTPTLPTELPTWLPTGTELPTIPTELPTTLLPTLPTLPTLPVGLPRSEAKAVEDVVMAEVAGGSVEQHTWLAQKSADPDVRGVRAEALGTTTDLAKPAVSFFDGEIAVRMASQPRLTAYADGTNPGLVTWTPPALSLLVAGQEAPLNLPADGTPVSVNYSENRQVVVKVSAGQLTNRLEDPNGAVASGRAAALHVTITRATDTGEQVVLDADLFPLSVEARSPQGGIECRVAPVASEAVLKARDNGRKADRLKLNALSVAEGAQVRLFRIVKGEPKRLGKATLNAKGDHVFKVKDKNGRKPTTYVARVAATDLTLAGRVKKKVR